MINKSISNSANISGMKDSESEKTAYPVEKTADAELDQILTRVAASIEERAELFADEIKEKIPSQQEQQEWLPLCPMPTDMCRVSPFFPLNRNELSARDFIKDLVITKSSWGEIVYSGPRLSTYEEDVLMAALLVLDNREHRREVSTRDKQKTYSYKGHIAPLAKAVDKSGGTGYKQILKAFELLVVAAVKISMGKEEKKREWAITNMFSFVKWNPKTKELAFTINPYFYEMYVEGNYTLIDLQKRMEIKSPVAKCLYRFIISHRDATWRGHYLTLAAALNLNPELPAFKIRDRIRGAIRDLTKMNILSKLSNIKGDIVTLQRTSTHKEPPKITRK